jgi:hypothetical protein
MKALFIHVLCLSLLLSCNNDNDNITQKAEGTIHMVDNFEAFPQDALIIKDAIVQGNTLQLTVNYGGGCGDTQFQLLGSPYFMESNPVQANVALSFKDEDLCEASIEKLLSYDLSRLADYYKNTHHTSSGTIMLNIQGFSTRVSYSF